MPRRRGFVLVVAILVSATLFFFTLMYVRLFRAEQDLSMRAERTLAAFEAASAGLWTAGNELRKASGWTAGWSKVVLPATGATYTVTFDKTLGLPYSTNNSSGTSAVTGWKGRTVPAGIIHVVSIGELGGATQQAEALMLPPLSPYFFALFGGNSVSLGANSVTDAYDSSVGPYATTVNVTKGNIGTNSTATNKVTISSGAAVKGYVQVGAGGSTSVIKNQGSYLGIVVPAADWVTTALVAPAKTGTSSPTVSGATYLAPGRYKNLTVNAGATLTLAAGTYVFNKVTIGDNVTITLSSGPVSVWFGQGLTIGKSSQINVGGKPGNLNFYGSGTSSGKVIVDSGTVGYLTLFAAWSDITVNANAELFGSLLGKTVGTGTGVKVHLDQTLKKQTTTFGVLTAW